MRDSIVSEVFATHEVLRAMNLEGEDSYTKSSSIRGGLKSLQVSMVLSLQRVLRKSRDCILSIDTYFKARQAIKTPYANIALYRPNGTLFGTKAKGGEKELGIKLTDIENDDPEIVGLRKSIWKHMKLYNCSELSDK